MSLTVEDTFDPHLNIFRGVVLAGERTPPRAEHERRVHLIDAVAVRNALLGTPGALKALERGVVITIADVNGFDRELIAEGLGVGRDAVDKAIGRRRQELSVAQKDLLACLMSEPAEDLRDAVAAGDARAVGEILCPLGVEELYALAVVLADMAGATGEATA